MGIGIWAMHFVAMLAFHLPVPIAYSPSDARVGRCRDRRLPLLALLVVSRPSSAYPCSFPRESSWEWRSLDALHRDGVNEGVRRHQLRRARRRAVHSDRDRRIGSGAVACIQISLRCVRPGAGAQGGFGAGDGSRNFRNALHRDGGGAFLESLMGMPTSNYMLATGQLGTAIVIGTLVIIALALTGGIVDRALRARPAITARLRAALEAEQLRAQEGEATTAALRASEEQLRQSQKMEAIGHLSGGIAHDFNNLLTVVRLNAEMLGDVIPDDRKGDLEELLRSTDRAAELTSKLLAFGRRCCLSRVCQARASPLGRLQRESCQPSANMSARRSRRGRDSRVVGERYGEVQSSGMSATHEEYLEARSHKRRLFSFRAALFSSRAKPNWSRIYALGPAA